MKLFARRPRPIKAMPMAADTSPTAMCDDLERRLKRAAEAANWPNVLHRCAWCNHLFDEHGAYGNVLAFDPEAIATDGMCPACAARALSQIAARRRSRKPLAA